MEAASGLLRSASFDWFRGITYEELETRTGIDRAQIARDFGGKENLQEELVDYCLSRGSQDFPNRLVARVAELLAQQDVAIDQIIMAAGELEEHRRGDRRMFTQMAMWALGQQDPKVASKVRDLYAEAQEQYETLLHDLMSLAEADGLVARSGLDVVEVVTLAIAMADGLALRASFESDAIPDGLVGRALLALTEGLLGQPADDGSGMPLGQLFASISSPATP